MITLENLKKSLFRPEFFKDCGDSIKINEPKNRNKSGTLKEVTIKTGGNIIELSHEYLSKSNGVYTDGGGQMNGDGTYIITKDNRQWLVVVEMKSEFAPKSFRQIMVTRTKFKAMLMTLGSYYEGRLEELAVIISYPIKLDKYDSNDNSEMMNFKFSHAIATMGCGSESYEYELGKEGETTLKTSDFKRLRALDINDDLRKGLKVKHIGIDSDKDGFNTSINIDDYLS